ncbi:hypothetical protein O7A70_23735 [Mesorhizobium sp. Cs1299R1N1]|uniref:hypothetical protein n=1 Tax=Mesorhizobium sp. Cs1299R1N1 TaxID=3015172 RepID=UPI00301BDA47
MRSFRTLKTVTLITLLITVPFAGAYANATPTSIADQAQGVDQGIADARQQNTITPAEAQRLHIQVVRITQAAERTAAADHGKIPAAQSQQLLRRLDNLDQRLMVDTGSGFAINDDNPDGNYPN